MSRCAYSTEAESARSRDAPAGKKAAKPKKRVAKREVAPKYKDPHSDAMWSGRGLTPKWLAEKEKAGAKREEFLIKGR